MLEADASAALRDRLLTELDGLTGSDAAALWAHRHLGEKNRLTTDDAKRVEDRFQIKLDELARTTAQEPLPAAEPEPKREPQAQMTPNSADAIAQDPLPSAQPEPVAEPQSQTAPIQPPRRAEPEQTRSPGRAKAIDKSVLTLSEPRRVRDRVHVKAVAQQPCLICGRQPSDAHHLRFAQNRALGRKVSDEFTVPLCRGHHREVHRCGDEAKWWRTLGIDPTVTARTLWLQSHPLPTDRSTPHNIINDDVAIHATGSGAATPLTKAKRGRRVAKGGADYETKPIARQAGSQ